VCFQYVQEGHGRFGFVVNNTIGGTPQPNKWSDSWVDFWRDHRLLHQANISGNSTLQRLAESIAEVLDVLFEGIEVRPSVLHGDLWSGNMAAVQGEPAVFDPAVYYGHSEAEFGMSWCAGFGQSFYDAYFQELPKEKGFDKRRDLYMAYHHMNHFNLFGASYLGESERLLRKVQKSIGL
jgi:protein-ribulosamine 3-kinase